jgi:hypothetical protein
LIPCYIIIKSLKEEWDCPVDAPRGLEEGVWELSWGISTENRVTRWSFPTWAAEGARSQINVRSLIRFTGSLWEPG